MDGLKQKLQKLSIKLLIKLKLLRQTEFSLLPDTESCFKSVYIERHYSIPCLTKVLCNNFFPIFSVNKKKKINKKIYLREQLRVGLKQITGTEIVGYCLSNKLSLM